MFKVGDTVVHKFTLHKYTVKAYHSTPHGQTDKIEVDTYPGMYPVSEFELFDITYNKFLYPLSCGVDAEQLSLAIGRTNMEGTSMKEAVISKCECGVDAVGGGNHSNWCPKHG